MAAALDRLWHTFSSVQLCGTPRRAPGAQHRHRPFTTPPSRPPPPALHLAAAVVACLAAGALAHPYPWAQQQAAALSSMQRAMANWQASAAAGSGPDAFEAMFNAQMDFYEAQQKAMAAMAQAGVSDDYYRAVAAMQAAQMAQMRAMMKANMEWARAASAPAAATAAATAAAAPAVTAAPVALVTVTAAPTATTTASGTATTTATATAQGRSLIKEPAP